MESLMKIYNEYSDEEIEESVQNTDAPVSKTTTYESSQQYKPITRSITQPATMNKIEEKMDANYDHVKMDMSENSSEESDGQVEVKPSESTIKRKRESSPKAKSFNDKDFGKRKERSTSRDRERIKNREKDRHKSSYSGSRERYRERDHRRDESKYRSKYRDDRKNLKYDKYSNYDRRDKERNKDKDYERRDRDKGYHKAKDRERTREKRSMSKEKECKSKFSLAEQQKNSEKSDPKLLAINSEIKKQEVPIVQVPSCSIDKFVANPALLKKPSDVALPAYYNPNIVNPTRYADQMQKRKLLWSHKKEEEATNSNVSKWESAKFSQDTDGKVASKFLRLMGVKDAKPKSDEIKPGDSIKKQEELFCTMEQQYEVARKATHTMRGLGLGFGSAQKPF